MINYEQWEQHQRHAGLRMGSSDLVGSSCKQRSTYVCFVVKTSLVLQASLMQGVGLELVLDLWDKNEENFNA